MVEEVRGDSWDDLETRSLMNAANHHTQQLLHQRKQYRSRQLIILILLGACAAMTFFKEDLSAIFLLKDEQEGEQVQSHIHNKHPSIVDFQKEQQEELEKGEAKEQAKEDFGSKDYYDDEDDDGKANNDDEDDDEKDEDDDTKPQEAEADQAQESISLAQIEELQNALSAARVNFDTILQEQYGDYTASIYEKTRLLQKVFPSESVISLERFQRRLKIKLLTSQLITSSSSSSSSQEKTTYIWAVGGHSASAGHGNLFSQSYGAVLEQLASPVFEAVGIQFYGKNFGMGGTSSAPELAMCMNAIFGFDLDVLSWDYGMTDGRNPHYYHMWAERAGSHPTNPILFTYGGRDAHDVYPILERTGRGGFHMNINEARNQIPDTEEVDLDQVVKYPPGVRYFMCNGHAESGEPCSQQEYKFNLTGYCDELPGQVSWHNGFKDHFLMGSLMASFVVDNLMEVMNEMISSHQDEGEEADRRWLRKRRVDEVEVTTTSGDEEESDPNQNEEEQEGSDGVAPSMTKVYLDYLLDLEKQDKAAFSASPPTSVIGPLGENVGAENYKHFLRSNAFCHTARLPAESRYNGLVTESGIVSPYVHAGRRDYIEEGYEEGKLPEPKPDDENKAPLLMYNITTVSGRNSRKICEHGKIDSKDAFVVRYTDQWSTMILPNNSEKEAFSSGDVSSEATEGIIMLCMVRFDWRNNPKDYVSTPSMIVNATSTDGIVVNDVKVTGYVETGEEDCIVIKHDDGFSFPASSSGQYKIKFRVPSQYVNGIFYLSSLVVV